MLCDRCNNINYDELISSEGYKHHASYIDLFQSALNGCKCCILIRDAGEQLRSILGTSGSPAWLSTLDHDGEGLGPSSQITWRASVTGAMPKGEIFSVVVCQYGRRAVKRPRRLAYLECELECATRAGTGFNLIPAEKFLI